MWSNNFYKPDKNWRIVPWENDDVNGFKWVVGSDSTSSVGTGPLNDFSGNGNYLYSEASSSQINDALIYTPYVDFGTNPYIQVAFLYHMRGQSMGTLILEQRQGQKWSILDSISGEQQKSIVDPWKKFEVLADSAQLTQFRFRMKKNTAGPLNLSFTQDAAIDDFSLTPISCPIPRQFDLSFSSVGRFSAQVDWDAGLNTNQYIIEYDTAGFSIGAGTIDTISGNSLLLSNLQAQTTYDFYVRFYCGASDTSILKGPYSFTTTCLPVTAPYIQTFNDSLIPECWTTHNQQGPDFPNAAWKPTEPISSGNLVFPAYGASGQNDHTGNNGFAIGVDGSFPFPLDSIAIYSPFIEVSSLIKPVLKMWVYSNNTDHPGENNTFYLDVFDGTQWNYNVLTYAKDSSDWVELEVDLKQFNSIDPIRIRLVVDKDSVNAAFYNDIVIDDFSITEGYGASCIAPTNLSVEDIHCDSATISWASDTATLLSQIKYGPSGFDYLTGGTLITNVSSPFTLNNLQVGEAYDIYIVDSCAEGLGINDTTFRTDSTLLPIINYNAGFYSTFGNFSVFFFDASSTIHGQDFTWDFGNGSIAQGDTALRTFYQNGTYPIVLTATNACGSVVDSFDLVINNIGLSEHTFRDNIKLYPNPSTGAFQIELLALEKQEIKLVLWSQFGTKVWVQEIVPDQPDYTLGTNIQGLASGMYILTVEDSKGNRVSKKLMVE